MSAEKQSGGSTDLIAGIAAAVTLLALLFLVHSVPMYASILLAVGVYIGVRLLTPAPKPAEPAAEPTESILADLERSAAGLPPGSVRSRLQGIVGISNSLLGYGSAHPDKAAESLFILRQYLNTLRTGVGRYTETLRTSPDSARRSQDTLAELLETVSNSLSHLHSELVEKETDDLTGDLRSLNRTLQELDSAWLIPGDKKE